MSWLDTRKPPLSEAQELGIVWLSKPLGARRTADAPNPRTMRWLVDHGFAAPAYEACGQCSACASRGVCRKGRSIMRLTTMGHQVTDHG
jgi:hypothetical protein